MRTRQRRPCPRSAGCTRYLVGSDGGRIERPGVLYTKAAEVAGRFLQRPGRLGTPVLDQFWENHGAALEIAMHAIEESFVRAGDLDSPMVWGRSDEGIPAEVETERLFALCDEHARQVARACCLVLFAEAMSAPTLMPDAKAFYTLGTLTSGLPWAGYAITLLLMGRSEGTINAEEFDKSVAGLRIFIRQMGKALPVSFFPLRSMSIAILFRASEACAEHQDALHEVLAEAVATRDLPAIQELVGALRYRLREFAHRSRQDARVSV